MIPQLIVPTHCMVWVYAEIVEMVPECGCMDLSDKDASNFIG